MLPDSKPNIALIVLDAVRADHVSCYGYARQTTPNIDRIAGEGILFKRAYATSCWTLPSHASLFTGLYPSQHRVDLDTQHLDPRHTTLATYLKNCGYRSACISCNAFVSDYTNLVRGFDLSIDVKRARKGDKGFASRLIRSIRGRWRDRFWRDHGADRATRLALSWLRKSDHDEPFFLFLNYMDCHLPYRLRLPQRYQFVAPADRQRVDLVPQDPFACMAGTLSLSDRDLLDLQALYDGCLYYLDQQIGILADQLSRLGLYDDTVFVVTSDHGESFGEHGLMDHQYGLYEHLVRVPWIMRLPEGRMAGQERDQLIQHVDLFPTISQLVANAGAQTSPPSLPGLSVLGDANRDAVIAEYLAPNLRAFHRRFPRADTARYNMAMRSIYAPPYKLIWRSDGHLELYDLEKDPSETANLADAQKDLNWKLQARLEGALGSWPELEALNTADDGMEQVRERLEQLGYL